MYINVHISVYMNAMVVSSGACGAIFETLHIPQLFFVPSKKYEVHDNFLDC